MSHADAPRVPTRKTGAADGALGKLQHLVPEEDARGTELLHGFDWGEADDGELHGADSADDPEEGVGFVHAGVERADEDDDGGVQADHVEHERVSAPGGHHVDVGQTRDRADPPRFAGAKGAAPDEEGEAHGGDGRSDSLSNPPALDRMVCAGTMAMTSAAMTAEVALPLHSAVRKATRQVATPPNQAGKKTQTSLRLMRQPSPSAPSDFQIATAVTCMPG